MSIESTCAGCGKTLSVADEHAGKRARCPACGRIYTVPPISADQPGGGLSSSSHNAGDFNFGQDSSRSPTSDSGSGRAPFSTEAANVPPEGVRYWMRAVDGTEYGPVDQATLDRWFREGRVGPGYQLRTSQYGNWQSADVFGSATTDRSYNPYSEAAASDNPYQPIDPTTNRSYYPKGDQGVSVLIMGILGFFCCPIFGIVAWIMGHNALNAMQAGLADPSGKALVQVGYYLGIASVILNVLCFGGQVIIALAGIGR